MLRAAYGLPLAPQQQEAFKAVAGGRLAPTNRVKELWAVAGRRSGKSRVAAAIAVAVATVEKHLLAPGEIGFVLVLSATVAQAHVVFSYAKAFLEESPVLRHHLIDATKSELRLTGNIIIGTHPNSFRSVRGRSLLAVICDETALWRDDSSANPDLEVYRAVKPALIASGGPLIGISSPYRKLGLLYNRHRDYFGVSDPNVLVVQGASRSFNPLLDEVGINAALADDPESSRAEWEGEFREDIAAFLSDADIDQCVDHDRPLELPPRNGIRYFAFADPSGGRHDAFCLAIGHREDERVVIDVLRGQMPPFDPHEIVREHAAVLKGFGLRELVGDNYSAEWVSTAYKSAGIRYVRSDVPKGRMYLENLPAFTRRTVSLPDHPTLLRELRLLERRTHVGGKDTVDHGRTGSDDFCNAVFGVLHSCSMKRQTLRYGTIGTPNANGVHQFNELDPKTGRPISRDPYRNPLSSEFNGCVTGKGPDAELSLFNAQRGIMRRIR
ncbi:terminase [Bradyrhizobium liaoningense]|uniref:terminase n=1 Tax=Bradyrhizobium liaoningense TaxID=43992 RepID=UPI001BAABA09|nr:terminase [Bradyrhizobium liaoningense]MBR0986536.1 terminase [Bradyrhizobium liaoningense]